MSNKTINYDEEAEVKNSLMDVSNKIKELTFKKRILGGVDLLDVWRKLSQIDKGYQEALKVQRSYFENQLLEKEKKVKELEEKLEKMTGS